MKNITLSAQDDKIAALRSVARAENRTVNDLFREWLDKDVATRERQQREKLATAFRSSVKRFSVKLDKKFTRQEMNQR